MKKKRGKIVCGFSVSALFRHLRRSYPRSVRPRSLRASWAMDRAIRCRKPPHGWAALVVSGLRATSQEAIDEPTLAGADVRVTVGCEIASAPRAPGSAPTVRRTGARRGPPHRRKARVGRQSPSILEVEPLQQGKLVSGCMRFWYQRGFHHDHHHGRRSGLAPDR